MFEDKALKYITSHFLTFAWEISSLCELFGYFKSSYIFNGSFFFPSKLFANIITHLVTLEKFIYLYRVTICIIENEHNEILMIIDYVQATAIQVKMFIVVFLFEMQPPFYVVEKLHLFEH